MTQPLSERSVAEQTRDWVERVVIGLNLCPFAKAVHAKAQIRYVVSQSESRPALLLQLGQELLGLAAADPEQIETTLLIVPRMLQDFLDYNDFLGEADAKLVELELEGELQIASFHPDYCFADAAPKDPANYTNRSPYPTLHMLREASVTRAIDAFPEPSSIYARNMQVLRALEPQGLALLFPRAHHSSKPPGRDA